MLENALNLKEISIPLHFLFLCHGYMQHADPGRKGKHDLGYNIQFVLVKTILNM